MKYLESKDIAERLCVSQDTARRVMRQMDHIQIGGRAGRARLRVEEAVFQQWVKENTIPGGTALPRATPWETAQQLQQREVKAWHKQRRAAAERNGTC